MSGPPSPNLAQLVIERGHELWPDERMVDTRAMRRTWRERLFSRPWRPWRKHRTEQVPKEEIYVLDLDDHRRAIIAHPSVIDRMRSVCLENTGD